MADQSAAAQEDSAKADPAVKAAAMRDRRLSALKEVRDWIDIVVKVVLAVAAAIVGYYFSYDKQQNDDIKLIVEMATANDSAKQLMSAAIAQEYVQQKRIPQALYVALFNYANTAPTTTDLRSVVNAGAAAAANAEPALKEALAKAEAILPTRIYFHIRDEADRQHAAELKNAIEAAPMEHGATIVVPGIEFVRGKQTQSVLKCFHKSECEQLGPELIRLFADHDVPVSLLDQSAAYEHSPSIRPNHFEAWFAPQFR